MWINGRRAVRPDGGFYRQGRRARVARGTRLTATAGARRSAGGAVIWLVGGVVAAAALAFIIMRVVW